MVEKLFEETIRKHRLLKKKEKLMIAVSGGPDSVCMLHLFSRLKTDLKLEVLCVHLNHRLREESDAEETFVRELCRKNRVSFVSRRQDVSGLDKGDSLEQTARKQRWDFFLACSRQYKIKKIAIAHNQDDLAETVLMRVIRGTGLQGVRAMRVKNKMYGIQVIRPLLFTRKRDILNWLRENTYPYRTDPSNYSEAFLRNKVRMKLIPALKEFNPRIVESLTNLAQSTALDFEFIHSCTQDCYQRIKKQHGSGYVKLHVAQLKEIHPALLPHVLRLAIAEIKGNARRLEAKHLTQLHEIILKKSPFSAVDLPDLRVVKENEWLLIKSLLFY